MSCKEGMENKKHSKDIAKEVQKDGAKHAKKEGKEYRDELKREGLLKPNANYPGGNIGGDPSTWSPESEPISSYTGPAGDTVDVYSSDANIPWYDDKHKHKKHHKHHNKNIGGDPATWTPPYLPQPNEHTHSKHHKHHRNYPAGIPASEIPAGDEDLYILKSQIVPPVCPACPSSATCPRQEPCQPCPPCARCPEPSFECKKVPNYSANNDQYLPRPVLNDFSSFGM